MAHPQQVSASALEERAARKVPPPLNNMPRPAGLKIFACCCSMFILAVPLWIGRPYIFQDWMNHLSRIYIINEIFQGNHFWNNFYDFRGFFVPNSLADIGILGFLHIGFQIDKASSLFLIMGFVFFVAGFCVCSYGGDALDVSKPILASMMFYNGPMAYGLVNFSLGLGIALAGIGIFLLQRTPTRQIAVSTLTVVFLFFCHVVSALVFSGIICLYTFLQALGYGRDSSKASRPWTSAGLALATPALLVCLLVLSPTAADVLPASDAARIAYVGSGSFLKLFIWKAGLLPKSLLDGAGVLPGMALLGGITCFFLLAVWGARLHLPRALALICVASVLAVFALPQRVGSGSLFDYRIALVPLLLLGAWVRVEWRSQRLAVAALVALVLAAGIRGASFASAAMRGNEIIREFDADAARIPPHSALFLVSGRNIRHIDREEYWDIPLQYLGTRAVTRGVFVPAIYAAAAQQPLVLKRAFAVLPGGTLTPTLEAALPEILAACTTLRERGLDHVVLFLAYPSAESDALLHAYSLLGHQAKYRLVQMC